MSTVSQTINLYAQAIPVAQQARSELDAINSQISSIDPKSTDAPATLKTLIAQYDSVKSKYQNQLNSIADQAGTAFDTLTEAEKIEVNQSPTLKTYNEIGTQSAARKEAHNNLVDLKNSAIAAAQTAGQPLASANPNNLAGEADGDNGAQNKTISSDKATVAASGAKSSVASTSTGTSDKTSSQRKSDSASSGTTDNVWHTPTEEFNPNMSTTVRPGRRLKNPLGYLASYTYQISLYMITPDAYDAFVAGGRKNINILSENNNSGNFVARQRAQAAAGIQTSDKVSGGAYLIAQSGGVGVTNGEQRAPGFAYDLAIDDLTFNHFIAPDATDSAVANTEMTFKITEPYGFSFITNLRDAQNEILKYAGGISNIPKNPTKQFFILGVRFFGWNQSGQAVKGSDTYDGAQLDPNSTGNSLFETFYDIVITGIKFKLDGRSTVYNVSAQTVPANLGVNIKKGMTKTSMDASGETVHDLLCGPDGFLTKLNIEEEKSVKSLPNQKPTRYRIKWLGDADQIAFASVRTDADTNKSTTVGSTAKTTTQSNDATATRSNPKNVSKISFEENKPIVQLIERAILKSSYVEDALKVVYTDNTENDPTSDSVPHIKPAQNKAIQWFSISPEISDLTWSSAIKDWTYTITYVIQTYYVPVIDSPAVAQTSKYYGPHKRYDYWYTGKNTEILSYESTLDNSFFVIALENQPDSSSTDAPGNANNNEAGAGAVATGLKSGTSPGGPGPRMEAASGVRTNICDPASTAQAKIEILGDPDFLMQPTTTGVNGAFAKFYSADSYTISPSGGQVFIEIDFKEAVDYSSSSVSNLDNYGKGINSQGGTLSINDSIVFWEYPKSITEPDPVTGKPLVQGISYRLRQLRSTFVGGAFKQTLETNINPLGGPEPKDNQDERPDTSNAPAKSGSPATTSTTPKEEKPPVQSAAPSNSGKALTSTAPQPVTRTGPGGAEVASEA